MSTKLLSERAKRFLNAREREHVEQAETVIAAKARGEKFSPEQSGLLGIEWTEVIDSTGGIKFIGRCPACALTGGDSEGKHLVAYPNPGGWKWKCITSWAHGGLETVAQVDHQKLVWKLAGGKKGGLKMPTPMPPKVRERRIIMEEDCIKKWVEAKEAYGQTLAEWQRGSGDLPDSPESDFRYYARACFKPPQLAWDGKRRDGPKAFQRHLIDIAGQTDRAWEMVEREGLDHTCGAVWKEGSLERKQKNHLSKNYYVVEHDGEGIEGQIALTTFLQLQGLRLILCVDTTNRGFHSLFDGTGMKPERRDLIAFFLSSIGADAGAFVRSATRTPGAIRQQQFKKTGEWDGKPYGSAQRIIYLPKTIN